MYFNFLLAFKQVSVSDFKKSLVISRNHIWKSNLENILKMSFINRIRKFKTKMKTSLWKSCPFTIKTKYKSLTIYEKIFTFQKFIHDRLIRVFLQCLLHRTITVFFYIGKINIGTSETKNYGRSKTSLVV